MESRAKKISFRASFNLLCWEGAFAMAYETWLGPTYISGLAGEMGVGVLWVTVLISMPWIGSVGQLAGILAYERVSSVKKYTLVAASIARTLWILPILLAGFWGIRQRYHSEPFPTSLWFSILAGTAFCSSLFASSSSVAWMSWMRGILPSSFRGRFFGVRQSYVMVTLTLANLFAAAWVGWKPNGYFVGYGLLGASALCLAFLSTYLLSKVPDVKIRHSVPSTSRNRSLLEAISEPLRDKHFRPILLYGALFNGVIQIAGPYFPYYFTKELQIPMSSVAIWSMIANLGCLLTAGAWGKWVDRSSHPRWVLWISCHLVSVSPLFYILPSATLVRWIAPFDFFLCGVSWAGYFLSMTTFVFSVAPAKKNAVYFSVYTAVVGLSCASFTWLGGHMVEWLAPFGGFRALWLVGATLRFVVIWSFLATPVFKPLQLSKRIASRFGV